LAQDPVGSELTDFCLALKLVQHLHSIFLV